MNIITKILKIYRVRDWYYYLGLVLLGIFIKSFSLIEMIKSLTLSSFLLAYAFSLNDFYDLNLKKKYFIYPFIFSLLFLPFSNFFQMIFIFLFLLIVTTYSIKIFRLKSKPIISTVSNGFGFSLLFLIGYFNDLAFDFFGIFFFFLLFSFQMVAQLVHEIVHYENDKKHKIITTAVFLRNKTVKIICVFFLLFALFLSFLVYYLKFVNFLFFMSTVVFVFLFLYKLKTKNVISFRKNYRNLGILLGIIYLISILLKNFRI